MHISDKHCVLTQITTGQCTLVIKIVHLDYDKAVHISDKHCVLTQIMTGQCTLQIKCVGIAYSFFFWSNTHPNLSKKFQMMFLRIERGFLIFHIRMFYEMLSWRNL